MLTLKNSDIPEYVRYLHRLVNDGEADNYKEMASGNIACLIEIFEQDEIKCADLLGATRVFMVYGGSSL